MRVGESFSWWRSKLLTLATASASLIFSQLSGTTNAHKLVFPQNHVRSVAGWQSGVKPHVICGFILFGGGGSTPPVLKVVLKGSTGGVAPEPSKFRTQDEKKIFFYHSSLVVCGLGCVCTVKYLPGGLTNFPGPKRRLAVT